MIYMSEKTGKKYGTEQECLDAEKAYEERMAAVKAEKEKKASERAARAKEVEEAMKDANAAYDHYKELLRKFNNDYGTFHVSLSGSSPFDMFDFLMRI